MTRTWTTASPRTRSRARPSRIDAPGGDLTPEERRRVAPYVTDPVGPVFCLTGLPEAVKGALFARYSRSAKPLRRILLEEFLPGGEGAPPPGDAPGAARAAALYGRVLADYGDDSVAQLGAAHLAVEGASNVLTKVIEWGRMASYLEQSTRYVPYDDRPGGRWRYHVPAGVAAAPTLAGAFRSTLDRAFATYAALIPDLVAHLGAAVPADPAVPAAARARALRAQALDALRGLLPAATTSNLGVFASGQAYEAMLVRLLGHPVAEAREVGALMLRELRKVIPDFLSRVDREDRGRRQGAYLARSAAAAAELAAGALGPPPPGPDGPAVRLVDFDPDGEARVLAHALWPASGLPLAEVRARVAALGPAERADALGAWARGRADRRERPGRALEATTYAFEVVADYGAYRDLQRHRLLSLQAQPLGAELGWDLPPEVAAAGAAEAYARVQDESAALWRALRDALPEEAPYAVTMAHRLRFTMVMNAREAMHVIELRSQPQGHATYRSVATEMRRLIAEDAGHRAIAGLMSFTAADDGGGGPGRLAQEGRAEARRRP